MLPAKAVTSCEPLVKVRTQRGRIHFHPFVGSPSVSTLHGESSLLPFCYLGIPYCTTGTVTGAVDPSGLFWK